ncbi:hypothetical protein CC79DRAFT_78942 [Sarocladium strictum]
MAMDFMKEHRISTASWLREKTLRHRPLSANDENLGQWSSQRGLGRVCVTASESINSGVAIVQSGAATINVGPSIVSRRLRKRKGDAAEGWEGSFVLSRGGRGTRGAAAGQWARGTKTRREVEEGATEGWQMRSFAGAGDNKLRHNLPGAQTSVSLLPCWSCRCSLIWEQEAGAGCCSCTEQLRPGQRNTTPSNCPLSGAGKK